MAAPSSVASSIRSISPNLIVMGLEGGHLKPEHVDRLLEMCERATCVVLGPGLGLHEETMEAVREFLSRVEERTKIVMDADSLKAVAGRLELVSGKRVVLTPHAGEFRIMTGVSLTTDVRERMEVVREIAAKYGVVFLVKGHYDVISDGKIARVNATGNPAMTAGGTGDVLTGILAAFASWTDDLMDAACAAAFVNGLAGDMASEELGNHITAFDLLDYIPRVFRKLGIEARPSRSYELLKRRE